LGPVGWQEPFGPRLARFPHPIKDLILTTVLGAIAGLCFGLATRFCLKGVLQKSVLQKALLQVVPTSCNEVDGAISEMDKVELASDAAKMEAEAVAPAVETLIPASAGALQGWAWHWLFLHVLAGALFGWQGIAVTSLIASLGVLLTCGSASSSDSAIGKRCGTESPKPVLMADALALAILTITLFVHLCTWRWVVQLWQFS
jgi:hypothetical protein